MQWSASAKEKQLAAAIAGQQRELAKLKLLQQQQQSTVVVANASAVAPWKQRLQQQQQQQLQQQQQQQQQGLKALSWADVVKAGDPSWSCGVCGRKHPGWHTACFPCQQQQQQQQQQQPLPTLGLQLAPRAAAVPSAVELLGEQAMDMALEDSALKLQVSGPELLALWSKLEVPEEKAGGSLGVPAATPDELLRTKETAVAEATKELETLQGLNVSSHIVSAAQAHLVSCTKVLTAAQQVAEANSTAQPSFAKLDRLRANAVETHVAWRARMRTKASAAWEDVEHALTAISHAEQALAAQKLALTARHTAYAEAWDRINTAVEAGHLDKIAKVEVQISSCQDAPAPVAKKARYHGDDDTSDTLLLARKEESLTALRSDMQAQMDLLNQRLADQAAAHNQQLTAVHREAADKVSSWQRHCDSLTAEREILKAALPPQPEPLSPTEKDERIALAEAAKESAAVANIGANY